MPDNATFRVLKWDEDAYDTIDAGPKLTRARVVKSYEGAIEGEGLLEMLMVHRPDGSAVFAGYERVRGRVDWRAGSFVFEHTGTFAAGTVKNRWVVVEGSGTGELGGLRGAAELEHDHAERYPFHFRYTIE